MIKKIFNKEKLKYMSGQFVDEDVNNLLILNNTFVRDISGAEIY